MSTAHLMVQYANSSEILGQWMSLPSLKIIRKQYRLVSVYAAWLSCCPRARSGDDNTPESFGAAG